MRARKPASDRKAEIVATAIRLAGEVGPDRVTTQMLADTIGISQPAIFRHFPSKTEIWLAVGEAIASRMSADEIDDGSPDPAGRLLDLVTAHFRYITENPAIPAVLFSRELHAQNDALRAHFERVMTSRRAGFAALIARAQAGGQIADAIPPEDLAALILAMIQGLAMRWSLESGRFDLTAEGPRLARKLLRK